MTTKVEFMTFMAKRVVDVAADPRLAAADTNHDGQIKGIELEALWRVIDGFDNDGNAKTVRDTDASGALTVPGALVQTVRESSRALPMPRLTPKQVIAKTVREKYAQYADSIAFTKDTQRDYFGVVDGKRAIGWANTQKAFERFIVKTDPTDPAHGPITFMGQPIVGGVNIYALPLLKAAEEQAKASGYAPLGKTLGYGFRGMKFGGVESKTIISMHSSGLAIDIDAGMNGPSKTNPSGNRGTIDDRAVLALIDNGFVWGAVGGKGFEELGDDPMHFQFSVHPDHPRYQEMIAKSAAAQKYDAALRAQREALDLPPLRTAE